MSATLRSINHELSHLGSRPPSRDPTSVFKIFEAYIDSKQISVCYQDFSTPYNFIQILLWLFCGLIFCLILQIWKPIVATVLALFLAFQAFLYFDWRSSILTRLPPLVKTQNFIARKENKLATKKLVLMAHWDTAPISIPYRPSMIGQFRNNVWIGMVFISGVVILSLGTLFGGFNEFIQVLTALLFLYFLVQIIVISLDFIRYGYSIGANDNATGCSVVIHIANQLWKDDYPDWEVEVVITGAEEVGMLGAKAYLDQLSDDNRSIYVINFDSLGCQKLQVITRSGTFTNIHYDNDMINLARSMASDLDMDITFGDYRTADVDTAWFTRQGIPSLSIISHNEDGVPSGIHRPEDTLDRVNWLTVTDASKLGLGIVQTLLGRPE